MLNLEDYFDESYVKDECVSNENCMINLSLSLKPSEDQKTYELTLNA